MNSEDIRAQLFEIERRQIREAQNRSFRQASYCPRCAGFQATNQTSEVTRESSDANAEVDVTLTQNSNEFSLTGSLVN